MTLKHFSNISRQVVKRHHVDTVSLATQAWNQNNCMKSLWIPSIAVDMIAWRRTWTGPVFGRKKWNRFRFYCPIFREVARSLTSIWYNFYNSSQVTCSCHFSYWTSHHVISIPLPMCGMTRHDHVDMLSRIRAMSDDVAVNDGWSLLILQNACTRGLPGVMKYFVSSDV